MGSLTSLFIRSDQKIQVVSEKLGELLNITFQREMREEGVLYVCSPFGITLTLFDDHDLEDDMGIRFSEYQYELDIQIAARGVTQDLVDLVHEDITRFLLSKVSQVPGWDCIAVANLQRIMEPH